MILVGKSLLNQCGMMFVASTERLAADQTGTGMGPVHAYTVVPFFSGRSQQRPPSLIRPTVSTRTHMTLLLRHLAW